MKLQAAATALCLLGPLDYTYVVLQVADHPDQTMVTYSAGQPPETGTADEPPWTRSP